MDDSEASMDEAAPVSDRGRRGGWVTFPFIIGTIAGLMLAAGGWTNNLTVYLIEEFNFKSIKAAKTYTFIYGSISIFPTIGGIIADSFLGSFTVIWFSSLLSLMGILLLVLTAAIKHLRPPTCENGSNMCIYPSGLQFSILYLSLALGSLGAAGTRFTIATMGADQFDNQKHQGIFFNCYSVTMYTSMVVSSTAIVYVEDNVSWTWGFTICAISNMLGLAVYLSGSQFYRLVKPRGSPFKSLACVAVAAISKRGMPLSLKSDDYHHDVKENGAETGAKNPTPFFRSLNRAALRTESDTKSDGSITNPWKLCSVQQVEDLKTLLRIFPLWSTGLLLCAPVAIQISLTIIQALTMDRHLGSHFKIPAGSMPVFFMIFTTISVFIIDRFVLPFWESFSQKPLTLLKCIGIGHILTIISIAFCAFVESKRLKTAKESRDFQNQTNINIVPMSVFWLVPQLAIAGVGEAFHFPGQVTLYYQEFPESLKNTSTAAVAMSRGLACFIGNALIDLVRRASGWLPDDINHGRLDNAYWICCILGALNFAYYLGCASLYKYQNVENLEDGCNKK